MALPLYIQTNASIDRARVRSRAQRQPDPLPALVENDSRSCSLYFIDEDGDYEPFSGASYATLDVRLGLLGQTPNASAVSVLTVASGWTFTLPVTPVTALFSSTVATVAAAWVEVRVTQTGNRQIFAQLPVEIRRALNS